MSDLIQVTPPPSKQPREGVGLPCSGGPGVCLQGLSREPPHCAPTQLWLLLSSGIPLPPLHLLTI